MDSQLLDSLLQAYLAQVDSAMRISDVLAKHDNSEEIMVDHLIGGLIYRLMVPMNETELSESLESAQQILTNINEVSDEVSDEESGEEYDMIDGYPEPLNRKIKAPMCECSICNQLKTCLLNYSEHICQDPLAEKFKASIDSTCEKHRIFIRDTQQLNEVYGKS